MIDKNQLISLLIKIIIDVALILIAYKLGFSDGVNYVKSHFICIAKNNSIFALR